MTDKSVTVTLNQVTAQAACGHVLHKHLKKSLQEVLDLEKDIHRFELHSSLYFQGQVALAKRLMSYLEILDSDLREEHHGIKS